MNSSNQKVGTYGTAPAKTQLYNSGQAQIWGHNSPATSAQNASWSIDWTSPAKGSGDVMMYTASVISNSNNSDNGDFVATKNLKITETATNSSNAINKQAFNVLYQTESNKLITSELMSKVLIWDYSGKLVKSVSLNDAECTLDGIKSGTYIVNVFAQSGEKSVLKVVVN
jgi:hypothetical protein